MHIQYYLTGLRSKIITLLLTLINLQCILPVPSLQKFMSKQQQQQQQFQFVMTIYYHYLQKKLLRGTL